MGSNLESVVRYKNLAIRPAFSHCDRAWVLGDFYRFWSLHASKLRPFFWVWNQEHFPQYCFDVTIQEGAVSVTVTDAHLIGDAYVFTIVLS
jgi:hypothetical protein